VTLVAFVATCFLGAGLSFAARRLYRLSIVIGLVGLVAGMIVALFWDTTAVEQIGLEMVGGDPFLRLFLMYGLLAAFLLTLLGATLSARGQASTATGPAVGPGPGLRGVIELPATSLVVFGFAAIALSAASPMAALLAAVAAGFATLTGFGLGRASAPLPRIAVAALRNLTVAAAIGIAGIAALVATSDPLQGDPTAVGLAFLAVGAAVLIRLGGIPFHRLVVAPTVNGASLTTPLMVAWGPIVLVIVAMAVLGSVLPALELPLSVERSAIVALAALSILLAAAVAAVQEDVHHAVAYSVVAQGGFALLAVAAFDPPPWEAARLWLLVFGLTSTSLVAWAVGLHAAFGSARLRDLSGWARRSPVLGIALGVIAVATLGLPGLAVFDARRELISAAVSGQIGGALVVGSYLAVVAYVRLLWIGLGPSSDAVVAARDWRIQRPAERPAPPARGSRPDGTPPTSPVGLADLGTPAAGRRRTAANAPPAATTAPRTSAAAGRTTAAGTGRTTAAAMARRGAPTMAAIAAPEPAHSAGRARVERDLRSWIDANVAPLAAAIVLVLAVLSVLAAAGVPNVRQSAAAHPPTQLAGSPVTAASPGPIESFQPIATP